MKFYRLTAIMALILILGLTGCTVEDADAVGWAHLNVRGQFDANGNRVINIGSPAQDNDAANKEYVDTSIAAIPAGGPYWEDLRFPANALKLSGVRPPAWSSVITPGETLSFEDIAVLGNEQQISFIVQIPHSWVVGTSIYFHLHYAYTSSIPDTRSLWTLEYDWQNNNALFGLGTHTISTYTDYSDTTALKNQTVSFTPVSGTGKNISSIIVCQLTRHSSDASDNYTDDVILLEIDVHYLTDGNGSSAQYEK